MGHELLRVPVSRLDARLITDEGASHEVTVFLPEGADVSYLFAAGEAFLPVSEEGRIRLFARARLAAIGVPTRSAPRAEDELLTEVRVLAVRLRGGAVVEGRLRHAPAVSGRARTADLLNDPAASFSLETDDRFFHIAKAHVCCVDEVSP